MTERCPICLDYRKIIKKDNNLFIYKCNSCCHTFTVIPKKKEEKYNDDYYKKIHKDWFDNPNYWLFEYIYNKIIKLFGDEQIKLLDIGCGAGDFLKYIAERNATIELFGIDLKANKHSCIHFIRGDFLTEKIENKFNVICSLAVIEHINNLHLFVQKLNNLLKSYGVLFIMTVNNNSLIYRIARLLNRVGIHVAYNRLYSFHHIQHYTNQSLKKLMEMNGFDVVLQENHSYSVNAVDVPKSNYLMEKINKLLVWIIFSLSVPFKCGMYQFIVCRKNN